MKPRRLLVSQDTCELFDLAVRDRALAVLTTQLGERWVSFKSRFLERDANRQFFVLDHQPLPGETLPVVTSGQYIGVSFRCKSRKILFATVVEAKGHYLLDDQSSVPAVRYRWPESVTELQRRAYYRTPVPDGTPLLASLWLGGVAARTAAQGRPLEVLTGQLADISCGGACVRMHQANAPEWTEGDVLGVQLQLGDDRAPITVDCYYRGIRPDDSGRLGVAIQFVGFELTIEGRQVLQRIAALVQKYHRLSCVAGARDWNSQYRRST